MAAGFPVLLTVRKEGNGMKKWTKGLLAGMALVAAAVAVPVSFYAAPQHSSAAVATTTTTTVSPTTVVKPIWD